MRRNKTEMMKSICWSALLLVGVMSGIAAAQAGPDEQPPADVRGRWVIYARDPNGTTDTKEVELQQNGNHLTGHFKGPHQSGKIVGTVNGRHIVFSTRTRQVLTFRGMADGDTMRGHFGIRGRHGEFEAKRLN